MERQLLLQPLAILRLQQSAAALPFAQAPAYYSANVEGTLGNTYPVLQNRGDVVLFYLGLRFDDRFWSLF